MALALLLLIGVLLGLLTPGQHTTIEFGSVSFLHGGGAPRVLASEYHDTFTTLWLLDADDPQQRTRLARLPHAVGWDIEASVSADQRAVAALAIPTGGWDPDTHAALWRIDASGIREVAADLDLRGGLIWSDDGDRVVVRRRGAITVLDARDGSPLGTWRAAAQMSPHTVAMRGDTVWATLLGANGTVLAELQLREGALQETRRTQISDGWTSDWVLAPDTRSIAWTEQGAGSGELSVRVAPLASDESDWGQAHLSANWSAPPVERYERSAMPIWQPSGEWAVGSWDGRSREVALPLAWDAAGRWLALRVMIGLGPGSIESEQLVWRGPEGDVISAPEAFRFVGWWSG